MTPDLYGYYWVGNSDPDIETVGRLEDQMDQWETDGYGRSVEVIVDRGRMAEHKFPKRPGARRLTDVIRSGDVVVIDRLNDLGRSFEDIVQFLAHLVDRWAISLYVIQETEGDQLYLTPEQLRAMTAAWKWAVPLIEGEVRSLEYAVIRAMSARVAGKKAAALGISFSKRYKGVPQWDEGEIAVLREIWSRWAQGETYRDIGLDLLARDVRTKGGALWCRRKGKPRSPGDLGRLCYERVRWAIQVMERVVAAGNPNHPFLAGWDWQSYLKSPASGNGDHDVPAPV